MGAVETTNRAKGLLEITHKYKMTLMDTLFPHKISRRTTWHSPDPGGVTRNQIDYILAPRQFKSSINRAKTRTFPGAEINSDHDSTMITMKLKLKKNRQPRKVERHSSFEATMESHLQHLTSW